MDDTGLWGAGADPGSALVLIVEDDPTQRQILTRLLEHEGYAVLGCLLYTSPSPRDRG